MKLNQVKYLPKTNAIADVYSKATGMPIVGELMAAAAGLSDEPTPEPEPEPTGSPIESVTLRCWVGDDYGVYVRVAEWFDEEYADQLAAGKVAYTTKILDANGNVIVNEPYLKELLCPRSDEECFGLIIDVNTLPTETGRYEFYIWTDNPSEDPADFWVTGEWTLVSC